VAVGAEQAVRARERDCAHFFQPDHGREPFQIELMHDAAARRNQSDVGEGLGAPFQEFESLSIAFNLDLLVETHRVGTSAVYGNQRVIAHKVDRNLGIYANWIAAACHDRVAQRRQVGHQGNAGKVLQQQAGRLKIQTAAPWTAHESREIKRGRVFGVTQRAFEKDFQRERQSARRA
jgi:hypothetical protein